MLVLRLWRRNPPSDPRESKLPAYKEIARRFSWEGRMLEIELRALNQARCALPQQTIRDVLDLVNRVQALTILADQDGVGSELCSSYEFAKLRIEVTWIAIHARVAVRWQQARA